MASSGIDKRKHVRFPIVIESRLTLDSVEYSGEISNISLGGAYLSLITPKLPASSIAQKAKLEIKVDIGWVSVVCQVVYLGENRELFPQGVGIAFSQDDTEVASVIWNVVMQHLS